MVRFLSRFSGAAGVGGAFVFASAGLTLLALEGCTRSSPASDSSAASAAAASSSGSSSPSITVTVLSADPQNSTLTVKGAGLPAPNPDGTETFKVISGDAAIGYVGRSIRGDTDFSMGAWRLDNIWPADPQLVQTTTSATEQLQRDRVDLGRNAYRDVGDTLPRFAFLNQNGDLVLPQSLRGKQVVVDFVFTRCTNPNMCPANSQRMAQLQQEVKKAGLPNVEFVTITIDPAHDTPGVLRDYAGEFGFDLANFQLLTAPPDEMTEALLQFGIDRKEENGTIVHTMATLLLSPEGRIAYRKNSDFWTIPEFLDRLKHNAS